MKIEPRRMTDTQLNSLARSVEEELEDCAVTIRQMQKNTSMLSPARVALLGELSKREQLLDSARLRLHKEKDRRNGQK
jgi:hypothetical protein